MDQLLYCDQKIYSFNIKDAMKYAGVNIAVTTIPVILTVLIKRYGKKKTDQILDKRNSKLSTLINNYDRTGGTLDSDPKKIKEYNKVLIELTMDTLRLSKNKIPKTKEGNDKEKTLMSVVIEPYITLIQSIVIHGVYIIKGEALGPRRTDFKLVYEPNALDFVDMIKMPNKNVIYSHAWPANNFEVSTISSHSANDLISGVNNFLASHPQFLSIRV